MKHNLEEIYKDCSQLKYIFYQELIWDKSNCTGKLRWKLGAYYETANVCGILIVLLLLLLLMQMEVYFEI
jgi:hypothetical protein